MKKLPRPSAALVVASLALAVSCTGVAAAATGNLVIGAKNQGAATTTLISKASVTGPTLKLKNAGGGPAAQFITNAGKAPFKVKGTTKVTGLNADLLDGLDSSAFRKSTDPVDAATVDGIDSSSFLRNDTTPLTSIQAMDASTRQTSATATGLFLNTNVNIYDPSNMRRAESDRIYANVAGTYLVSATVEWSPNGVGYRNTTILDQDGNTVASAIGAPTASPAYHVQNVVGIVHLEADGYVRVQVVQGSGGNLDVRLWRFEVTYVGA